MNSPYGHGLPSLILHARIHHTQILLLLSFFFHSRSVSS
jgi:hypothetical protein